MPPQTPNPTPPSAPAAPDAQSLPVSGEVPVATPATAQPAVAAQDQVHQIQAPDTGTTEQYSIEPFLEEVIRRDASDLHIQVGLPPMLRVDGALSPLNGTAAMTPEQIDEIIFSLLDEEQKEIYIHDKEIDFSFAYGDLGRFRVNAFHERGNPAGAFRLIPNKIRTLEELGMPAIMNKMTEYPR